MINIIQTLLIFVLGYQTAKLIRLYKDQMFLDELHDRICEKILDDELLKKDIVDNIVIIEIEDTNDTEA